jgi:hypothetical protein
LEKYVFLASCRSLDCLLFGQVRGFHKADLFTSSLVLRLLEDIDILFQTATTAHQEAMRRVQGPQGKLQWLLALPDEALRVSRHRSAWSKTRGAKALKAETYSVKTKRRLEGKQRPPADYHQHWQVYRCPVCDKRWTINGSPQRHMRTHRSGRAPGQLVITNKCPARHKAFSSRESARRHFNTKTCPSSRTTAWDRHITGYLAGTQERTDGTIPISNYFR